MRTLLLLGTTFVLIVISIFNNISVLYPLTAGLVIMGINGVTLGFKVDEIIHMAVKGIKRSAIIYKVFALIGAIISVWMASGTVPGLMYYGFMIIDPKSFVLTSFILASGISMLLGTSLGTVSTIGIALMALGRGVGINPGVVAGAIISGAYLGDRSSPMSSSAILTSVVTETRLYENLKHMISTMIPAFILSAVLYYIVGRSFAAEALDISKIAELQMDLKGNFNITLVVLIPPIIIMILPLFKVDIKINMLVGIVTGGILAAVLQGVPMLQLFRYMVLGYSGEISNEFLSRIIQGGGILSMVKLGGIIAVSSALNGIFEGAKMMDSLLDSFTNDIKSPVGLVFKTALMSVVTAMYGCSQTLSIIMTSYVMKPVYKRTNIAGPSFARTIGDTCVVLSPLIPWNIAGLVPATNMGVRVVDFLPYAYLSMILPLISMLYARLGLIKREEKV